MKWQKDKILKTLLFLLLVLLIILLIVMNGDKIYHIYLFYYADYFDKVGTSNSGNSDKDDEEYSTVVEHTNVYSDVTIDSYEAALDLIRDDSALQSDKCDNDGITEIENLIMSETGITAINLCELDVEFANNLRIVLKNLYESYPILEEYVTNVTLVNAGGTGVYIAAFKPSTTFATSSSSNKFPYVIKIQVFLNASYYLNLSYLDKVTENAVSTSYFPDGTNGYSLIVHEFAHVLTYIACEKYYAESKLSARDDIYLKYDNFKSYADVLNKYTNSIFSELIVKEAWNNYVSEVGDVELSDFILGISLYAYSMSSSGGIIYNETVAEAFHDYYLNGDYAAKESIYIVNVFNKYLNM